MVQKSYGKRSGSRNKLKMKEQLTISKILKPFEIGDRVYIKLVAAIHNFPNPKFHGKTGEVIGKRGSAYIIRVKDMNAEKKVIVTSVHLKKHK